MTHMISRAKDKDTGFWREGYYACESNHACFGNELKYEHFIFVDEFMDWNLGGLQQYTVDPKTVGRFTGLHDKNGKMIFEGDIVDCWSEGVNAKGTVQQRVDGLWIIYPAWQNTIMWGLCPDEYTKTTVEVIGNIHDNPELLEEGEPDDR